MEINKGPDLCVVYALKMELTTHLCSGSSTQINACLIILAQCGMAFSRSLFIYHSDSSALWGECVNSLFWEKAGSLAEVNVVNVVNVAS
jgi:hypothetical protein